MSNIPIRGFGPDDLMLTEGIGFDGVQAPSGAERGRGYFAVDAVSSLQLTIVEVGAAALTLTAVGALSVVPAGVVEEAGTASFSLTATASIETTAEVTVDRHRVRGARKAVPVAPVANECVCEVRQAAQLSQGTVEQLQRFGL